MNDRMSRRELEALLSRLSDRDMLILRTILDYRYLTTGQLQRLYFAGASTPSAALRATSRNLNKLKALSLIGNLERRIGGAKSGSSANIWRMEPAGDHLLRLKDGATRPRRKGFTPSTFFLSHTLAVAECYVQIIEICAESRIKLTAIYDEPESWRSYNSGGRIVTLKPDLFAITVCGAYEDRWFIEVDLDTESPIRIIEKCQRYHQYYRSGLEQKQYGVFPLVIWIVPNLERKTNLIERIRTEFAKQPRLFAVITPDELKMLISEGAESAEGIMLC